MEDLVALNVAPLNAPHKELEWLPLAVKDFQMKDLTGDKNHLQAVFEIRNSHRSNSHLYGIWESNLPIYYLPSVNVFLDVIHLCCANYEPTKRVVMTPTRTVLFYITPESINEMLHFKPTQPLAPLSMGFLLEQGSKLPNSEITRIAQTFMRPDCQPTTPPPYVHVWFNEARRFIIDMISYILGFKTIEYVDETTLFLLSIFTPGQPPAVKYDYATFIANKIHEQFMSLDREGVFKYSSYIYHLFLYYKTDNFSFLSKNWIPKEKEGL